MKKSVRFMGRRVLCVFLACVTVLSVCMIGGTSVSSADSKLTDATVKNYEDQLATLAAQQKQIEKNLNKLQQEEASYLSYKSELDTYLDTTARKMEAANTLLAELQTQIAEKREEIADTESAYDRTYQQFLDMMVMSYEEGEASYIGLILGADSLSDFLSRVENVSSMLSYSRSVMNSLRETEELLTAEEVALQEKIDLQEETLAALAEDETLYNQKLEDATAAIAKLDQDQAVAQKAYYENKALEDQLDKELQEYLQELQRKNQAKMEAGEWLWPIRLDVQQYVSSGYGWRMLWGVWDFHRGWDIACYLGNDIRASKSGTVVISTYHYSYGNYVVIDHGDGVSTVYAHASKLLVSVGDKVQQGDVIAKVGTSGSSTGYHLHFEFRLNGQYTDPYNYIPSPPISTPASKYEKG